MPRMITHSRQIFDQQGDARQRPEVGPVALRQRACQERGGHGFQLRGGQLRFGSGGTFTGQRGLAAFLPRLLPAVSSLTRDAQAAGDLRGGNFFGEEFGRLLAAFFHCGVVSRLRHVQI